MTDTINETEVVEDPVEDPTDTTEGTEIEETVESEVDEDGDSFPRDYVEKLRRENAKYRERAGQADDLSQRLHAALVAATGRLADPSDLAFDPAHLDDDSALSAALDDILARKPHLANRRPRGDVGQGVSGPTDSVSLAGILRSRA